MDSEMECDMQESNVDMKLEKGMCDAFTILQCIQHGIAIFIIVTPYVIYNRYVVFPSLSQNGYGIFCIKLAFFLKCGFIRFSSEQIVDGCRLQRSSWHSAISEEYWTGKLECKSLWTMTRMLKKIMQIVELMNKKIKHLKANHCSPLLFIESYSIKKQGKKTKKTKQKMLPQKSQHW